MGAASAAKGTGIRATILALTLCLTPLTASAQTPPSESFTLATQTPAETRHLNAHKPPGYDAKALDEGIRVGEVTPPILVGVKNTERRVLFIGNSLTYVNNLPSAFASLAPADLHVSVDMIARAGAALEDYDHDPIVMRALATGGYTDVILQERGGNAMCAPGCEKHLAAFARTDASTVSLARAARASGANVYYLGTWQRANAEVSANEVRGERRIAALAGITLIELSETRRRLVEAYPDAAWTHADGEHPGHTMTALMALRTWYAVMGESSTRRPCVAGPLWYHAPYPEGVVHIDTMAAPTTCLVDAPMAAKLAAAP